MNIVKMEEVCQFINGGSWSEKEYVNYGIPVLKVSNCKNNKFQIEDISYLPFTLRQKYAKNKLSKGDVIIATVGSHPNLIESSAGRSVVVNSLVDGFYLNQNAVCLRTKNSDILDQVYLGYLCRERNFVHYIQNKGRGAANQMRIAISSIKEYEFNLPSIYEQRQLANILSAYDDLIENNEKQIKLLEEAAQRLYKEWFIDLRFPGYEDIEIVDGIPEGWNINRADHYFKVTIGKTPSRAEKQWFTNSGEGTPWISISDMGEAGAFAFYSKEDLTADAIVRHNMKVVPKGTILVSFKLTVGRLAITGVDMCTNEAIAHFYIDNDLDRAYTYCYLKNFEYDSLGNTSSISKAINSKIIKSMPFIMPTRDILERFSMIVQPILDQIELKQKMIFRLTEARNRLLPKLMSGEIEV